MFISSNTGSFSHDSFEEYKAALETCFQPENEIWCSRTEEDKYPCLSILVKGDRLWSTILRRRTAVRCWSPSATRMRKTL